MLLCLPVDALARYGCRRAGTCRKLKSRPFAIKFVHLSKIAGDTTTQPGCFQAARHHRIKMPELGPTLRLSQTFPQGRAADGPCDLPSTWDPRPDVKKNPVTERPIYNSRAGVHVNRRGVAGHFLACGGVPHRRSEAVAKWFACDTAKGPLRATWDRSDTLGWKKLLGSAINPTYFDTRRKSVRLDGLHAGNTALDSVHKET